MTGAGTQKPIGLSFPKGNMVEDMPQARARFSMLWNSPATWAVRSSAVGPSPPLVTIRSTPSWARKASAARMSRGRSPTTEMWASSTPSSRRRSDSHGPLRSVTRPLRTSVPVTTIPARAAISRRCRWSGGAGRPG